MSHAWVSVLPGNYSGEHDRIPEDRLTQNTYLVEKDLFRVGYFDIHCIYVISGKMTEIIYLDVELEIVLYCQCPVCFLFKYEQHLRE